MQSWSTLIISLMFRLGVHNGVCGYGHWLTWEISVEHYIGMFIRTIYVRQISFVSKLELFKWGCNVARFICLIVELLRGLGQIHAEIDEIAVRLRHIRGAFCEMSAKFWVTYSAVAALRLDRTHRVIPNCVADDSEESGCCIWCVFIFAKAKLVWANDIVFLCPVV